MIMYEVLNEPNQQFSVAENGHDFTFRFRTFRKLTYVDVSVDGVLKIGGVKASPNVGLLTNELKSLAQGDFMFTSTTGNYPNYELMNTPECLFVYVPSGE